MLPLVCTLALALSVIPSRAAQTFPDVKHGAWYFRAVETAAERGWVQGTGDGLYAPELLLSRQEFLTLLVRAFCPDRVVSTSPPSLWYLPFCQAALEAGLLNGTDLLLRLQASAGDWNQAGAGEAITRCEMALLLSNTASVQGTPLPEDPAAAARISDWDTIPLRFRNAVSACFAAGLLQGTGDGRFSGTGTVDRAQAATVLCRLYETLSGEDLHVDPVPDEVLASLQQEVLTLVNGQRSLAGLTPLHLDPRLCSAARIRADEITETFDHLRPDGSGCFTVLDDLGIVRGLVGENIAKGYATPAEVVDGWMHSPEHRVNILDPGFRHLGVGYETLGTRTFWVQLFTS